MSLNLKRKRIDSSLEKRILTGLIVSTQYLREIYPLLNLAYLQNSYAGKVADWCIQFYDIYEKCPYKDIQSIFEKKRADLKDEEAEIVSKLLSEISEKYEIEQGINVPYLIDETEAYFKRRELEIRTENVRILLAENKIKEAEDQFEQFRKVQKITSNWVNPLDDKEIDKTFAEQDTTFFQMPGQLGDFLGAYEREWLVGISGPFKKGKSFLSQEFGIIGIFSGLRVAFFSLEMSLKQMKKRIYRRLTATGNKEDDFKYPMFDCWFNQTGECEMMERRNKITLLGEDQRPPEYSPDMLYKPCTHCRGKNDNYALATWYETIHRPKFNLENVAKEIKPIQKRFGNMFRIKAYPKFTANVGDIMRDLDVLEHTEGFTPDIVIVDYADILKPEDEIVSGVDKEDRTWIALAQLAGIRKVLVIAPTQVNKEAMEARQVKSKHTARWVGKLGHVEVMLAMSQTAEEKEQGIMRISTIMHRHEDFNEENNCVILQNIKVGQTLLDSEKERR